MEGDAVRRLLWIVWPAFAVAGVAETVFFTVFDPFELHFFGAPLELSRQAMYTLGFFGFWGVCIASSTLTAFLERSRNRVRGTVDAETRTGSAPDEDSDGHTR